MTQQLARRGAYKEDIAFELGVSPKTGGGWRVVGVVTLRDRVLQRAVLQVFTPRFERRSMRRSCGYRPRSNTQPPSRPVRSARGRAATGK